MFYPIAIHGKGEYAENYTEVSFDEETRETGLRVINSETGCVDSSQYLSLDEVAELTEALGKIYIGAALKAAGLPADLFKGVGIG